MIKWVIVFQILIGFFFYGVMRNHDAVKYGPFKKKNDCNSIRVEVIAFYETAGVLFNATSCFEEP